MDFPSYFKKRQGTDEDPDEETLAAALASAPSRAGAYGGQDTPDSVGAAPIPNAAPMTPAKPWLQMRHSESSKMKTGGGPPKPQLLPVDDSKRQEIINLLDPAQIGGLVQQQKGLNELQDTYDRQRSKTPNVDMSSLLALSDSWNGGNLSKGYQAPLRQDDLDKMANDLQVRLQGARQGLSEDEVNLLKARLGAEEKHQDTASRLNAQMQESYDRSQANLTAKQIASTNAWAMKSLQAGDRNTQNNTKYALSAAKDFNTDADVVDSVKSSKNADTAQGILDMALTNPTARQAAKLELARMVVPQRLNETEIAAFGGSTAAGQKLGQIFNDMENGVLTKENYDFMTQFVTGMKRSAEGNISKRLDHHATQFSKATGVPFDEAREVIGGTYAAPQQGGGAAAGGGGFPKTVTNGKGQSASVANADELKEAQQEGFQ